MKLTLESAIAAFGAAAKKKLSNASASGQPEDQLRAPFESLLGDLAELLAIPKKKIAAVGETSLSELKTRPDYSVTVHGALVGFVEIKAPGKGAIRANSATPTTRPSGRNCVRCPTCSTPTATPSAFGRTANWSMPSSRSSATSNRPAKN